MVGGVFISWRDLYGGPKSTLEDVAKELSGIPRLFATEQLTRLCAKLDPADQKTTFEVDAHARKFLLTREVDQRIRGYATGAHRIAFYRPQLLVALQLAQKLCSDADPGTLSTTDEIAGACLRLGRALLRISDHLSLTLDPDPRDWRTLAPHLLLLYGQYNPGALLNSLRRTRAMLLDPRWGTDARLGGALRRFKDAFGLTPADYMSAVLGVIVKLRERSGRADPSLRLGRVFAEARDGEVLRRVFAGMSCSIEELPSEVPAPERALLTFSEEPFRSRPLIALPGDRFWPVDQTYLTERALAGIFWKLMELGTDPENDDLLNAWGGLFEGVMNDHLSQVFGRKYFPNPTDRRGDEVTDGILLDKPDLIFFDFKAGLIPDAAKKGGSFDAITGAVERKFVKDAQPQRALDRLCADNFLAQSFLCASPARVYPIVVALDHWGAAPFMAAIATESLRGASTATTQDPRATLAPLAIITADDAEALAVLRSHGKKVRNVMRSYVEEEPFGWNTFHNHLVSHARQMGISLMGPSKDAFHSPFGDASAYWRSQGSDELFGSI